MAVITTANLRSEQFYRELVIPTLYSESKVLRSLRRIETDSTKAHIPYVGPANVGWVAEGAPLPDANPGPGQLAVTPAKVAAYADLTNESVSDANAAEIVGEALAQALARQVDKAFLLAQTNGPTALPAVTGVLTVTADPDASVDPYVDALALMEAEGASPTVVFVSPTTWALLSKIKETAGSAKPALSPPTVGPTGAIQRSVHGIPVEVVADCPNDLAWVVDGTRVAAVIRQDGTVEADSSVGFRSDLTVLRVVGRVGFGAPYAKAICKIAPA